MNRSAKIWLLAGTCLILAGCILLGGVLMANNFQWGALSTVKFETNKSELSQTFQNILIVTDTADIEFLPSDTTAGKVVCRELKKVRHTVAVQNGTLTVQVNDSRKWYEHIGIQFHTPKITLYLPKGEYGELSIQSSTGNATIPADFQFGSMDISLSTGHITNHASTSGDLHLKTDTGNIRVENISANAIALHISTGNTTLTDITCKSLSSEGDTGNITLTNITATKKFSIERTTGDIKLMRCDAAEIIMTTDTGNISGNLLTNKIFITKTDTGNIDVPACTTGGTCQITTSTGNIKIHIAK